jgi:hypothetical protein
VIFFVFAPSSGSLAHPVSRQANEIIRVPIDTFVLFIKTAPFLDDAL